jgi:hypothetical protein
MNFNVLGTDYLLKIIESEDRDQFPDLSEEMDGYCNYYTKEIVVVKDDSDTQGHEEYVDQVIRHELIHAYLFESGLHDYSMDETLVDWLSIQIPKIAEEFTDGNLI